MRVEDRVGEEGRGAAWSFFGRFRERRAEELEQRAEIFGGFVERDGDRCRVEETEVDAGLSGAGDQGWGGLVFWSHADRIEKRGVVDAVAGVFEGLGEIGGVSVDALGDGAESLGAMINGIHRGHDGKENLGGADVTGRLVAADVLLAGLEREAQGGIASGVFRNSDKAAGEAALVFIAGREESGVGSAVAGRDAKALARTDHDIGPTFARRLQEGERQKVGGNDGEGADRVGTGDEFFQVANRAVGGWVLKEGCKDWFGGEVFGRAGENLDPKRFGAGLKNSEGLWMDMVGDENRIAALDVVTKRHRLGGSGGLVEQGGVGNLHPGEVANHRLEIQKRLETALRDLGLIGRVGGIPAGIFENVSSDHGGRVRAVDADAKVVRGDFVLRHDRTEVSKGLFLGARGGELQVVFKPDRSGNGFVDQGVDGRHANSGAHGFDFLGVGADMAVGKCGHVETREYAKPTANGEENCGGSGCF